MKGSCQCRNITYEVPDDYIALIACYCSECQKASTGIGTYSMLVATDKFTLKSGSLNNWEHSSDSGAKNTVYFCPKCSNRIYHKNPNDPRFIRLKAGTLDDASKLEPDAHCWIQSSPKWVRLPEDALAYQTQPSIEEGLLAIKVRRKKTVNRQRQADE